ncbi:MAG: hypothetical protein MJY56_05600 [Bacteroidales bacterium]|nr:hypothetical protein [Bacteroidales bacterium]
MKKSTLILAAIAALTLLASCDKEPKGGNDSGNNQNNPPKVVIKPVQDPIEGDFTYEYALDKYWADDYDGPYGIKVGKITAISPDNRMILAGQPLYVAGINCYNLMTQNQDCGDANFENVKQTINILAEEKVPIVRFSVIPWGADDINNKYVANKAAYLERLDQIATLCDEKHILLVPSLCWEITQMIKSTGEYTAESIAPWGNLKSKVYLLMIDMATDLVNTLKDHKCIAMWEFGNEMNLQANINGGGEYPALPADAVQRAARGFAKKCFELDPHQRLVGSGYSIMRNAQWHLYKENNWNDDSYDQYVEITGLMTPEPMMGMSEHHYLGDNRKFSDLGQQDHVNQIKYAKKCAAELGKVFYCGEFTGPACSNVGLEYPNQYYEDFFSERVQICMIWNFILKNNASGADFRPGEAGTIGVFSKMREINDKFKALSNPE